jgi:nitrate reductase molybdenum cofactor assembly chaperone NarJ/NarW
MRSRTEVLDGLGVLIGYPKADLGPRVRACLAGLAAISPAAATDLASFGDATAGTPLAQLQEHYTESFDLSPTCALDVGWHLFGDAHKRGAFMAALREDLRRVEVPETAELPDHLTHVLRLLGREAPPRAAVLAATIAPAIETVQRALARRGSPYRHLLSAVAAVVASVLAERPREVTLS